MQDALEVPTFSGSEEAQVAEGLIDAYRKGDAEVVRQFVASHSIFLELDNQVLSCASFCCAQQVAEALAWPHLLVSGTSPKLECLQHTCELQVLMPVSCLATQVVRLARKLPQGDVKVLAASLGAHQLSAERGADEDDLT